MQLKIITTMEKLRNLNYGFIADMFNAGVGPKISNQKKVKLEVIAESDDFYLVKTTMNFWGKWSAGYEWFLEDYEEFDFYKVGTTVHFDNSEKFGVLVSKKHFKLL